LLGAAGSRGFLLPFGKDSKIGELSARFDVVVGLTPEEPGATRRR
jgi:hypothetical protein